MCDCVVEKVGVVEGGCVQLFRACAIVVRVGEGGVV